MRYFLPLFFPLLLLATWKELPDTAANYESAKSACRDLGGTWRLPDIRELFPLRGKTEQFSANESFWADNTFYDGIVVGNTGSEGEGGELEGTKRGYTFFLKDGDIAITPLQKETGVLCTNSAKPNFKQQFALSKSGVIDKERDIVWMSLDASDKKKRYTYDEAQEACERSDYNGRSWRLPTLDELYGIVTYGQNRPSVNTSLFGMMMHRYYWSGDAFNADDAYVVGFKFGSVATSSKRNRSYVRCVSEL